MIKPLTSHGIFFRCRQYRREWNPQYQAARGSEEAAVALVITWQCKIIFNDFPTKAPLIGHFCCVWIPVDPQFLCSLCNKLGGRPFWAIPRLLSCLGLTITEDVKMGKTIILLICTTGYVYMDIWTCVYSFQCSGIDLHLHSFSMWKPCDLPVICQGPCCDQKVLGVAFLGYYWVIPISS